MYRLRGDRIEVFLVHPGGPIWQNRDEGAWSIPKGLVEEGEDLLQSAIREFEEETGFKINSKHFIPLEPVRLKSGKTIYAWAFEGDCDPQEIKSNTFKMQWPPGSGKIREFPEVDRAGWFSLEEAEKKLNPAQVAFLGNLRKMLKG